MCVGNLFKPPKPPAPPPRMKPAPPLKSPAPPPEMPTPDKITDDEGDDEKLSTRKRKALEVKQAKEGVKTFGAVDPSTMPQGPEGGITGP